MTIPRAQMSEEQIKHVRAQGVANARSAYARWMTIVYEAKNNPCVDCGRDDLPPEVMDLDHVRGIKMFNVSQPHYAKRLPGLTKLETLAIEVAKCDPRCPTCHRLRHWKESNHSRLPIEPPTPFPNHNSLKTHCPQGHAYTGDNLYIDSIGRRYCRKCRAETQTRLRKRRTQQTVTIS